MKRIRLGVSSGSIQDTSSCNQRIFRKAAYVFLSLKDFAILARIRANRRWSAELMGAGAMTCNIEERALEC
jgi:hypothetical protein